MHPVAIFRHSRSEGPGYFAIFLEQHGIPWRLIAIDEDDPVPENSGDFSGLCFMGGPMSVNDPLPWIEPVCALIRHAAANAIPVIGHCLGGQLMSKAFGGHVTANPVMEIGWGEVKAIDNQEDAHQWLGMLAGQSLTAFHWHGETFSLPPGTRHLLTSNGCANQAFVLGPHLALQCHLEMTPEMIFAWSRNWDPEAAGLAPPPATVQSTEAMRQQTTACLPAMRQLADQLYSVWIKGLRP